MATPITTRQYGTNAKGSPLSFSELDTNFLYFQNIATTTAGTFPIIGTGEKTVQAGGGITIVYPAGKATTESIMRQVGGFGTTAGEIIVNGSASFSGSIGVLLTASLAYATGSFTGITNGTHLGVMTGSLLGTASGVFLGAASGSFTGDIIGTASYTSVPLQTVLTSGNTASIGFQVNGGNVNFNGGTVLLDNAVNFTVNGTSLLNGNVTTQNTRIGNTNGDVHAMSGSFFSDAFTTFNKRVTASAPVYLNTTLDITGIQTSTNATDSTVATAGSIVTAGGIGIAKNAFVSGTLNIAGVATLANGTDATTATAAGTLVVGGLGIAKQLRVGGATTITGITQLSSNLGVTGSLTTSNTTDATTTSTGAIITAGGVGIAKALWVGGLINITGVATLSGGTAAELTCDASTVEFSAGTVYNSSTSREVRVKDLGITTAKIAATAVTTAKIDALAVTTAKIADANVTTAKIADANVTTVKIADSNVTTAKINDSAVTTDKINALAVTTAKIADANVTNAKIADGTIANDKLVNSSVTVTAGTNLTTGGAVALGSSVTINVVNNPTFSGNVTAPGFYQSSKRSLKTSIMPFEKDALDIIKKTNIVEFFYLTDLGNKHIGFIADDTPAELSTKNQDTMDTNSTLAVALKAIQQLEERIKVLEANNK